MEMIGSVEVFVSYADKDKQLWKELENHLIPFQRKGLITLWEYSVHWSMGEEWKHDVISHLDSAHLILLLISQYYLASDYLSHFEMVRAMERHNAREAIVLPILLRPVYWQDEPFGQLQVFPENARPITMWRKKEAAFFQTAMRIRKAVEQLHAGQ